ncbi:MULTISPECIES: phage holin family protein [Sphingomonadales]|uniref:Phage holin family protein n=2 Tax=Edaphosphingomonas TaxID=3423724 RepID=A0A2T4I5G1_9SPHN|nr:MULTISPECIES: phage holin family protein [Sphingomonas]AGH50334.1 hypothetical protein G432_13075 [Sphingomonas sp. MM-1]MDX3885445.1 phage holin family protein [Sphingomonas sp.]OHT18744.1 hypothetical protein BHE75_00720 [Sphingomonas haloaromaticamans]PTD25170.1 hypothetical protein CV103_06275 [Sphingomonas fennica]
MAGAKEPGTSIGELFNRAVDQGGELIRAELAVYRRLAIRRALAARLAVALMLAGVLIALGSASALMIGFAIGLARFIGPVGGGIVAGLAGFLVAGLLVREGLKRLPTVAPPEEDEPTQAERDR